MVVANGEEIRLTPIETKFLYLLLGSNGRTVPTETIMQRIWPTESHAYEDRLHAAVYRLRKKIEPDPKHPKYIVADWAKGYHLTREFTEV